MSVNAFQQKGGGGSYAAVSPAVLGGSPSCMENLAQFNSSAAMGRLTLCSALAKACLPQSGTDAPQSVVLLVPQGWLRGAYEQYLHNARYMAEGTYYGQLPLLTWPAAVQYAQQSVQNILTCLAALQPMLLVRLWCWAPILFLLLLPIQEDSDQKTA